jgi:Tol biopolymer transport system component
VVTNLGTAASFDLRASDDNNFVSSISPVTVTLGTNETRNVVVTLAPPATAGNKALDTLTVTAQGTGASEAFNSATVQSIVKATLNVALNDFTTTEVGGNQNGIVEAGENGSLVVQLVNTGGNTVTGIHATVAAASPGVIVNDGSADFPNIAPSDVGTNPTPFTFSLAGNTTFGLSINLTLTVNYAGAAQPFVVNLSVPVGGSPPLPPDQIIFSTFRDGNQEIYRIDPDGDHLVNLTNNSRPDFLPIVSPDMSKIAFVTRRDSAPRIYVMNADGTNQQPVTADRNDLAYESKSSWSPDGTKLAFVRYINFVPQISVVNIDGSNETALTNEATDSASPAWSPDGTKIAFTRRGDFNNNLSTYNADLFLMNPDGSNVVRLTTNLAASEPAWSPDGSKLVFVTVGAYNPTFERHNQEIRVINADGSNLRQLTNITRSQNPSWSHDGSKIVFASDRGNTSNFEIFLMNADGTNQVNLINDGAFNSGFPPNDLEPALSPDGTQIAYTRLGTEIGVVNTDGTGKLSILQGQYTVLSTTWLRPNSSPPPTGKAATVTSLVSSNPNATYGDSITLSATVSSTAGTPSGTVQFFDGANSLGTTALSNGVASLTLGTLSSGTHSLKAVYAETENFAGSESAISQAVAPAPLEIKAADSSRIYGVSNPAFTVSFSGFKLTDDPSALSGTLAFVTEATAASNAGAYLVVPAGLSSPNYNITFVSGTLTINRAPTQTSADSTTIAAGSSIALSGTLKNSFGVALPGRTVSLTLGAGAGAQSCSGVTNTSGVASCSITNASQPLGPGTVSASFAGDGNYLSSSATASTLVFAYPAGAAGGEFVIGDVNAQAGAAVTFWGSQWASSNALSGGSAPSSFKGFANSTSSTPVNCGGTWTTGPGNSSGPPNTVPSYMAVIIASAVSKSGSTISGNTRGVAIVRTNSGYSGSPGHAGNGTIIQVLCMQ